MLEVFHRQGIVRRPIVISPFFTKVSVSGPQDVENTLSKVESFLVEGLEDFDVISHRKFEKEALRNAQWELRHISRFHFSELIIRVLYNDENTLLVEFSRSNKSSASVFHDIFHKIKPYLEDQAFVQWSSENKINLNNYSSNPREGFGGPLPTAAFILQPYFDVLHNVERSVSERSSPDSIITAAQIVSETAHADDLDPSIYRTCVNILAQTLIYGEDYKLDTLQFVLVHFQALCNAGDGHFIDIESEKLPRLMNALVMIAGKCIEGSSVEGSTTASGIVSLITEQDVGIISFGKSVQVALDILYSIVTRTDRSFEELNELARKVMQRLGDQIRRLDSLRLLRPDLQTALTKCTTTQKKSKDGKEK